MIWTMMENAKAIFSWPVGGATKLQTTVDSSCGDIAFVFDNHIHHHSNRKSRDRPTL